MSTDEKFHYVTNDPKIVSAFKEWSRDYKQWRERIDQVAARYGRKPVTFLLGRPRFVGFTQKKGESRNPRDYKSTAWVRTDAGYLRPRVSHREGKQLQAEMDKIGTFRSPYEILRGIPKMYGALATPGLMLTATQDALIATYGESVKHDARWRPIKQSEYWQHRETAEAQQAPEATA